MTDTTTLIQRLSDEADLCRNDGATDVAKLLDDAVYEIVRQMNNVKWMKLRVEQQAAHLSELQASYDRIEQAEYEMNQRIEQQAAQIAEKDAEIARVTAELEALKGDLDPLFKDLADYGEENEALRADAGRLRAALEFIATHQSSEWPERCRINVQTARAALDSIDGIDAALRQEQPNE